MGSSRARAAPRPGRAAASGVRPVAGFIVRCVLYAAAGLAAIARWPVIEEAGIRLTIATVQRAFAAFGVEVERAGDALWVGSTSVRMVSDCSPHIPYVLFAAVVLAFPSSWTRRLIGLVAGAAVIHVFNSLRIVALVIVLLRRPQWFEFAHVYLWQTGTVLVLFAAFALWLRFVAVPARAADAPSSARS